MQQPQTDQQIQQPIQYTTPQYQQLQQPIMLCPVQYVYDPLLPDEQVQSSHVQPFQNQAYVINVQNTPPWAQSRPNVVYMQQMPRNIQPYIPQHMVQNPMYNYQYQPMIVQEQIRQVPGFLNQSMIQNPQMIPNVMNQQIMQRVQNSQMMQNITQNPMQNAVQNQQLMQSMTQSQLVAQNPAMMNPNIINNPIRYQMEKRETPILASMLNGRKTLNQNDLVSLIRPQFQTVRPQMIIVNPITKHTCTHNTQKETAPTPLPIENQLKNDLQLIKSQVPEGLSVKTIKTPVTTVQSSENIQNIALSEELYPKPKQTSTRNPQTNYKRKIRELLELNNKNGNEAIGKRSCYMNKPDEQILNAQAMIDIPPNASESQMSITGPNQTQTMSAKTKVEEKKIRNTVYVQARGIVNDTRVNNDVPNINYANISNSSMNIENSVLNNTNIGSFNFNDNAMTVNANLNLNNKNIEYLNSVTVNNVNVGQNIIMHVNNPGMEINNENKMHINGIQNLIDAMMQCENNESNVNTDDAIVSEEVQNVKDTAVEKKHLKEKIAAGNKKDHKVNLKNIILEENNRQDEAKLSQIASSNEVGITIENSSITLKKLIANDAQSKTKKTKNTKVTEANTTQNITNTSQTAKMIASNDSNDLQSKSITTHSTKLPKKSEDDDLARKSTTTETSNTTNIASDKDELDVNQNKSDVKSISEDTSTKTLKNKTTLGEDDESDKLMQTISRKEKQMNSKNTMLNADVFAKPMPIYVLTHVLDGHIIQESNVPFQVQKPSIPAKNKAIEKEAEAKDTCLERTNEKTEDKTENITVETEVSSNTGTDVMERREEESESESDSDSSDETIDDVETKGVDEDHPFKHLNKETVAAWTVADVYSHLMEYEGWRATAMMLDEQEIDGESLLLVSKEQLIQIGICEEQAQEINEFIEQ